MTDVTEMCFEKNSLQFILKSYQIQTANLKILLKLLGFSKEAAAKHAT